MYTTSELIINSKKFTKVEDLYLNFDLISDLLKEDVQRICLAKNIFFSDFDASFATSVAQTRATLTKKHLRAIKKRFFACKNLKSAINFLISRILNNMLNANDTKRKFAFKAPKFASLEDYNISKSYNIDTEIELENLENTDKEIIKQGLKKVWEDGKFDADFDLQDLKDLCSKYNINLYNVIDEKELELPNLGTYQLESGLKQGFFVFYFDEEAAA